MQSFDVKRSSRKCCKTDQPFRPGETYYSALVDTTKGLVRQDYSMDAWAEVWPTVPPGAEEENSEASEEQSLAVESGQPPQDQPPDEEIIGWWKQRVPELESGKIYWAPEDVQIAYFNSLYEQSPQDDTTFVLALLLVQKKWLALDDSEVPNTMMLTHRKSNQTYEIPELEIPAERISTIQKQLAENLFSDQPADDDPGN